MKYCMHCGAEISNEAEFCGNCGKGVSSGSKDNIEFSDVARYAGQQAKKAVGGIQSKAQDFQESHSIEKEERKIKDVGEMFVNPDEEQKAVIGGGYLANMIHTGTVGKGFGILTNRRFYFKGKCFYKVGKHFMKTDEERTVDLQDITSSGFIYTRFFLWIVLAVLDIVGAIAMIESCTSSYRGFQGSDILSIVFLLIIDIVFWLIYIFYKRAIYEISFAGGSIAIKASSYGIKEIKAFDKQLRLAKDEYLATSKRQEK